MGRGRGTKSGSVHIDDLPERVKKDFERYLEEESNEYERSRVVDEQSAREFINSVLPRKPGLGAFFPTGRDKADDKDMQMIIDGGLIQGLIRRNVESQEKVGAAGAGGAPNLQALAEAQRVEARRRRGARVVDESKDARVIRRATQPNVRRWKRAPGRTDIAGVDTRVKYPRVGRRGRLLTPKRTSKWVRQVVSRGTYGYYVYRNPRSGKFVKNPERRR